MLIFIQAGTHTLLWTKYYTHTHKSLGYSPEPLQIFISAEHDQQQNHKKERGMNGGKEEDIKGERKYEQESGMGRGKSRAK